MLSRLLASVAFLACSATIASSADISMRDDGGQTIITVSGKLQNYDARVFLSMTANVRSGTVVLNSTGGSAYAAVEIGGAIRRLNLATSVSSKVGPCKSACALAWLAGNPRQLDEGAQVGFHAAFSIEDGKPVMTGVANALIGAYMRDLGLSDAVIVFATDARPGTMKYLSKDDARRIGLSVDYVDGQSNVIETVPDPFLPEGTVPIPALSESPG